MDYLEWELERQRGALRALLGGGGREDAGTARKDEARSGPAGMEAKGAGGTGRPAASGGTGEEPPKTRATVRETGAAPPKGEDGGPDLPVSAWEQVWREERYAPGQRGWDGPEEETPETPPKPAREGTGLPAASSGKRAGNPPARRAESAESERPLGRSGERRTGESGGGAASGGGTAALGPARRRPVWAPEPEETSGGAAFRGSGGDAAPPAEDGARALSRAVQRDARRYDGGFTIY